VSGRVTDEKGAPVAGARVGFAAESNMRALVRGGPAAFLGRSGVATGPDGAFRLRGLGPERNRTLEATKVGWVPARRHGVTLKSGEVVKDVALILKRGLEARGRVVDPAGKPIAEASVRVSRPEGETSRFMFRIGGMEDRQKPDAWSAADGTFRVAGLEPGEYVLVVQREGYALKQVPSVKVQAEGANDWPPVVLSPGVALAGFVRNGKGEPVVGAQVSSFAIDAGPRGTATTDPEGRFRLDGFGSDRAVMLSVTAEGYAPVRREVTPPSEDLAIVLKTTGTIRGRVEDAGSNQPVTDFSASYRAPRTGGFGGGMQIRMGGDTEKSFQSPDGTFELTDVPAGKWNVIASAAGYRPAEVAGIEIGEGETKEGVILSLKKGASVSGRVLDPRRGTGVPNASVSWSQDSGQRPGIAMLARLAGESTAVATDADGRYRVDGLPAGKITITAEHPDYLGASRQVEVDDEATVDLTLSVGGSIAGSVVGKDGRSALPGAAVTLDVPGGGLRVEEESTRTDAAGGFLFEHLKPGRYRLSAQSNAGGTASKEVVLAESQPLEGVLLQMQGGAVILGTVSGLPAGQLGGVRISAYAQNYEDNTITGGDGRFTLNDVPAGVVRVGAMTAVLSGRTTWKNVEVPEGGGEVAVEIVFEGSSRLAGRVTRGERPLAGIFVQASSDSPPAGDSRASAQTDENGQYAIEGLTDGNYQVQLAGSGGGYRRSFTISGDTKGDIALPAVSLTGMVTEAGSGDPIEGASVQAESGSETSTFAMKRAVTDSRGFYSIDDLDSASYQVTARREGYEGKTQPASVGSASLELNFQLSRGAGLAIRAVDGLTGLPLRDLRALAYTGNRTVAFSGGVSLDAEGKGEIASLAPGVYAVYLFSGGYATASIPSVQVPSPTLTVPMTPGGRLEVRTQTPVTGQIVSAAGGFYLLDWWRLDGRISAGPPVAAWDNIAPGSYALITSGASGEKSYPFSVTEGRTTTVEVK
jgi:protocatechuate 3,4-dioxygenase beta subunit